jgi:hypothetical protein
MFSSIFESSIFNDKKDETMSNRMDLQSAFQRLQELEAQKSDYLSKLVEVDQKIQKQLDVLGNLIEKKEEEIVLRGNSLSRQSSIQFEPIGRGETLTNSIDLATHSRISLMHENSILPVSKNATKRMATSEQLDDSKKTKLTAVFKSFPEKRELNSLKQYIIGRTERKARSILTYPYSAGMFCSTIVTTSLDGKVHFWSAKTEQREHTVEKMNWSTNEKDWCEDIKWITPDTLCLAPFSSSNLILLHRMNSRHEFERKELPVVHSKGVNVLERLGESQFVSGGQDKKVYLWDIQDTNRTRTLKVHDEHTSRIHSLCYLPQQKLLYSGGQDCRLFCTDVETTRILYGHERLDGSVRDILRIPGSHDSILVLYIFLSSVQDPLYTVRVFDTRSKAFCMKIPTRVQQTDGYQKIQVHQNGHLVSVPLPTAGGGLEIYDLRYCLLTRYNKVDEERGQLLKVDKLRVLEAPFVNDKLWCLTTNHLEIIEYK